MKLTPIKRWRRKQFKVKSAPNSKVCKKFKRKRDLSGKFMILLNSLKSKNAIILKFISRRRCKAKFAVAINEGILRQTSRKWIIAPGRNQKVLRRSKVIVTKKFRKAYEELCARPVSIVDAAVTRPLPIVSTPLPQSIKRITPIKILSCNICNHKFTNKSHYDKHIAEHDEELDSSCSETELMIDDDVMLVCEEGQNGTVQKQQPLILNLKKDPDESSPITATESVHRKPTNGTTNEFIRKDPRARTVVTNSVSLHREPQLAVGTTNEPTRAPTVVTTSVPIYRDPRLAVGIINEPTRAPTVGTKSIPIRKIPRRLSTVRIPKNKNRKPKIPQAKETIQPEKVPEQHVCMESACQQVFSSESLLIAHSVIDHPKIDDRKFKCNKCPEKYKRESSLLAHQRITHPVEIIEPLPMEPRKMTRRKSVYVPKEPESNGPPPKARRKSVYVERPKSPEGVLYKSRTNFSLPKAPSKTPIKFQRYDSKKKTFVCRICSQTYDQRDHLDRHISVQHITRLYNCYKCDGKFQVNKLLPHFKLYHLNHVNDQKAISTFSNLNDFAVHCCGFCNYSSQVRSEVVVHMKNEHYELYEKGEVQEEELASSPDSLENLATPESAKILEIQEEEDDLLVEIEPKTKRKPANDPSFKFRCARCFRRFSRQDSLKTHMCERQQADPSKVSQPVVPLPELNASQLNIAQNLPTTSFAKIAQKLPMVNGFFRCSQCPSVFFNKDRLNEHSKQHESANTSAILQPKSAPSNGFYGSNSLV